MSTLRTCDFYLAFISEQFSCDELTRLIGAQPDVGWSKGDAYVVRGTRKSYKFSRWALLEHASGTDNDWEYAINRLIARAGPLENSMVSVPSEVAIKLQVNLTEDNGIFGFSLLSSQIVFMARIRASLDMSIVVQNSAEV